MHRLTCPFCGVRDEVEFRYRGDASLQRPKAGAAADAFVAFVYERANPAGWHLEWWAHVHGCRQVHKVLRHTGTHAVAWTGTAQQFPPAHLLKHDRTSS